MVHLYTNSGQEDMQVNTTYTRPVENNASRVIKATDFAMSITGRGAEFSAYEGQGANMQDIMKNAGAMDVTANRNYMTVMSNSLSDEEKAEIKAQVEFYKKIRGAIQFGSMYRLSSPFENKCTAWNFVSPDGETVVFGLYNVLGKPLAICDTVCLCGLDADAEYKDEETGKIHYYFDNFTD